MTYYEQLQARCSDLDHFDEDDSKYLLAGVQMIDFLGLEWKLLQVKTKFGFDDLRFYVSGDMAVQKAARAIEEIWYRKYRDYE